MTKLLDFDYADFGCSSGGCMDFVRSIFPDLRGVGIDIDPDKLSLANERGHATRQLDILTLQKQRQFGFVTMAHFLEHLTSTTEMRNIIIRAIQVARGFALIRQPFFDSDGELFKLGLKTYWSDWTGHKNHATSLDFYRICALLLERKVINSFAILHRGRIESSLHPAIIPLSAPCDSPSYRPEMGFKAFHELTFTCSEEVVVDIVINNNWHSFQRKKLMQKLNVRSKLEVVFKSEAYPGF